MSWTTIGLLAAGAYLFKAMGLLVFGPAAIGRRRNDAAPGAGPLGGPADPGAMAEPGLALRIGQLLPPALLAALVVSQTVVTDSRLVLDARLAGVVAGTVAVLRGAPFWLVLVIAATVTAVLRAAVG